MSEAELMHLRCELRSHDEDVRAVCALPDGRIATGSRDKMIKIWFETGDAEYELMKTLVGHTDYVSALAYVPASSALSRSIDNSSEMEATNEMGGELIPGGKEALVSGSRDTTVGIWDLQDGSMKQQWKGHQYQVTALSVDSANGRVISGSLDKTARVWKNSGDCERVLEGHETAILSAAVFPGEDVVATGSGDCTIRLWRISDGECLRTVHAHGDTVRGLSVHPDLGLISASHDGTIKFWSKTGECIVEMMGHKALIYSVAVSPDGMVIATGSEDNTAKIWRADGTLIQVLDHPGCVWDVAFLPNGDLITGCADGVARIWSTSEIRCAPCNIQEAFQANLSSNKKGADERGTGQTSDDALQEGLPPGLKIEDPSILANPGARDGQIVVVKEGSCGVAYSWDSSKSDWERIGEVVSEPSNTIDESHKVKKWHDGQEWDYVFDVDVADGVPPLKLALNRGDNPYDVADRFIEAYNLPVSYQEQIVQFILQNTDGAEVQQITEDNGFVDPYTGASAYVPPPPSANTSEAIGGIGQVTGGGVDPYTGQNMSQSKRHVPANSYLVFDKPPPSDALRKKLLEFVEKIHIDEHLVGCPSPNADEELSLTNLVNNISSNDSGKDIDYIAASHLLSDILLKWPASILFPCLDLVRMIILDPKAVDVLLGGIGHISKDSPEGSLGYALYKALSAVPPVSSSQQVAFRCMCNCFSENRMQRWFQNELAHVLSYIEDFMVSTVSPCTKGIRLGLATLLFNISIMLSRMVSNELEMKLQVLGLAHKLLLSTPKEEEENMYRAMVALGTLLPEHSSIRQKANELGLLDMAKGMRGTRGKIGEVARELESNLRY